MHIFILQIIQVYVFSTFAGKGKSLKGMILFLKSKNHSQHEFSEEKKLLLISLCGMIV